VTEVVGPFRKSSFSGAENNCVEVATVAPGGRAVRDSKNHQAGRMLTFTPDGWQAFLDASKVGAFGRSNRA
jgi:hypothetical protein